MNARKLAILACVAASCAGCVTETKRVDVTPDTMAKLKNVKEASVAKREATPLTWVSVGRMHEASADDPKVPPLQQSNCRDEARKAYQKAMELDPHCIDAHICLAQLYLKQDDTERAVETYKHALKANPSSALLWFQQGDIVLRRKDVATALVCLGKAHELDAQNGHYAKQYGLCLAFAGRPKEAVTVLCRVENKAEAHYTVARMLEFQKQPELSRQYLAVALDERPTHEGAQALLRRLNGPASAPALAGTMTDPNVRPASLGGPVTQP